MLKTLAVLLLAVLLPLRAVAAVTIGHCATGQQDTAVEAHVGHAHDGHGLPAKPDCSVCVEHCSSAAFAPSAAQPVTGITVTESSAPLAAPAAPAFISDQLDRPPLA